MGLPTSIPSGGDGLDRFSKPQAPRAAEPEAVAQQPEAPSRSTQQRLTQKAPVQQKRSPRPKSNPLPEATPVVPPQEAPVTGAVDPDYAAFLNWKAAQEADKASPQEAAAAPRRAEAPQPVQTDELPDEAAGDVPLDGDWVTDAKTGKRYKRLPQASREAVRAYKGTKGAGFTLDEMKRFVGFQENFDIDDLNGTAELFMPPRLRTPPSKEEQEAILRRKAQLAEEQRAKRAEIDQELNASEGILDEPEVDPFAENQKAKRGLFGRKR